MQNVTAVVPVVLPRTEPYRPPPARSRDDEPDETEGDSGYVANGVDRRELRKLRRGQYAVGRRLDLHGFTHYNALAVAASPTLVGDRMLIMDNQGTTLVMTTGPEPKVVERNFIGTQIERRVPLPGQEILAYAPPIVDGDRLYLRGERYLYCIGRGK